MNLMKLITKKQQKSYKNAKKILYLLKKHAKDQDAEDTKSCEVRNHSHYAGEYRSVANSIYNLKYSVPE